MNNVFTAKLLQNLNNKKGNKGFTLIELLVVVIIIGVLAAVALPNLLSQVGKARETEGKNGVGTINRAQQGFHFERRVFNNGADVTLANNPLGVVINPDFYAFTVAGNAGIDATVTAIDAAAAANGTRNYGGGIGFDAGAYSTAICQSDAVGGAATADVAAPAAVVCGAGTELN
ncbi:prepilin-type N-terminal cleavage/methylation domain-containing protein [Waterburya agarophytonicola K14]|uniref:Prepilin-type N-terminal cleavage/methylation domain-containing protein n=1 Tax=Waterburya agarophytonicola KI4 TaxID=2874699 RepID=A0A964BP39_9CYAN|nr:type IV pilin-like G/H family protein [Waterburya agarophytonicola]MCC0175576.1 prepilin-type N-terminal cleavage/methylation domain-containing protein [Waterburya agarophytonicola KI4]